MNAYASRTGTRRNLDALESAGWRLLATAGTLDRYKHPSPTWADHAPAPYALDNGAWSAFTNGRCFDVPAFEEALSLLGGGAEGEYALELNGVSAAGRTKQDECVVSIKEFT